MVTSQLSIAPLLRRDQSFYLTIMRTALFIAFISLFSSVCNQVLGATPNELKNEFSKHSIELNNDLLIIGINTGDCGLHMLDIGKVIKTLQNRNTSNVVIVAIGTNDIHAFLENKIGFTTPSIPAIYDDKLYSMCTSVPITFCGLLTENDFQLSSLDMFFRWSNKIQEHYQMAIKASIDLSYIDGFTMWSWAKANHSYIMSDYQSQHVASLNKTDGTLQAAALARNLNIPDSVRKILCEDNATFELSLEMKNTGGYRFRALDEFKIMGVSAEKDKVYIYFDYFYFRGQKKDTAILHRPVIGVFDENLQFQNAIFIEGRDKVARKHYMYFMANSQFIANNKLYNNLLSQFDDRKQFVQSIREKKGNQFVLENKILFRINPLIEKESLKESDGTFDCDFFENDKIVYAYHKEFPILYLIQNDKMNEVWLECESYQEKKDLLRKESYYTFHAAPTKNHRIFAYRKDGGKKYISCHNSSGKIVAKELLSDLILKSVPEDTKILDTFNTIIHTEDGKRIAIEVVIW